MERVKEFKGITGNLTVFKEEVKNVETIGYAGVPGVCTPFAELFAYAARDKKSIFIPNTNFEKARELVLTEYGVELGDVKPYKVDAIVLLGGLAMPKIGAKIEDVKKLIDESLKENGKVIGICFMDMFRKAGWYEQIDFDSVINADIEGFVVK